jgi:photosystem II stability/assembly factor-like uncharacterized protein
MKPTSIIFSFLMIFLWHDISSANGTQCNWRWRKDDGDVRSATWKDSLNTPVILTEYENIRLRIEVMFKDPDSTNISLRYAEDLSAESWIPVTSVDTGKFFISASDYLFDAMTYSDNAFLPPSDSLNFYRMTITFDSTDKYFLVSPGNSSYELEYSLKPTLRVQAGTAYYFSLFCDSVRIHLGDASEHALLMTPPVNWTIQSSCRPYNLSGVSFVNANIGTIVGYDWKHSSGIILRTTDGGNTWVSQLSGIDASLTDVCFSDANTGTAVGRGGNGGIILRTTDGGKNWARQPCSITTNNLYAVSFSDANCGTVVGSFWSGWDRCIFLRTTDGGNNWFSQSGDPNSMFFGVIFTDAKNGTAVGASGDILRTIDGGNYWGHQYRSGNSGGCLLGVSFADANNGAAVGNSGTIVRTTNSGITWMSQSSGTTNDLYGVCFTDAYNGTVVGAKGTILRTTDGGDHWISQSSHRIDGLADACFVDAHTGWVVGGNGTILRTTNGGVTFVEREKIDEVPTEFSLSQNYPNPFNPSTTIKYQLPKSSVVRLSVYDILGREVSILLNERRDAGVHEVKFDAAGLSSGVYFYRIQAGSFVETRKLLLLR